MAMRKVKCCATRSATRWTLAFLISLHEVPFACTIYQRFLNPAQSLDTILAHHSAAPPSAINYSNEIAIEIAARTGHDQPVRHTRHPTEQESQPQKPTEHSYQLTRQRLNRLVCRRTTSRDLTSSNLIPDRRLQGRGHTNVKIAYKTQHRTRTSLLSGEQSYEALHAHSFGSADNRPLVQEVYQSGGYHDREGLATTLNSPKTHKRLYIPRSRWTVAFSIIVFLQALIALALEAYVFGKFETSLQTGRHDDDTSTIPTYLALFIFGFLYQLGLTYDALKNRNTIQIIGLCLYNYGMMIYSAIETNQVYTAVQRLLSEGSINPQAWTNLKPFLVAAPCIIALGSILMSFVAYKLYQEFAWDIYKSISADLKMRHRYLTYQIYIALLKFDFFFFLGFSVQFLVIIGSNFTDTEFYLTIIALPITIALLLLAAYFCRRESKAGQSFIILIYFAAMAYFVFKLIRMWDSHNPGKVAEYLSARTSLTTFAVITIILLTVTITTAVLCIRNFDKGLKPYVMKSTTGAEFDAPKHYGDEYGQPLNTVPGRMVID